MIRWRGITIDRNKRMISHRGETLYLSPIVFRLASTLLLAGPASKEALFDHIYDDREDGGPLSGIRVLDVMLVRVRKKLAAIGVEMRADAPWNFYNKHYWAEPAWRKLRVNGVPVCIGCGHVGTLHIEDNSATCSNCNTILPAEAA